MAYIKRGRHPNDPLGELLGDTHWPLADKYYTMPKLVAAIDLRSMRFIATGEYRVVWERSMETAKPKDVAIGPASSIRLFDIFTTEQLVLLYSNTLGTTPTFQSYEDLLLQCTTLYKAIVALPIPRCLFYYGNPVTLNKEGPTPPRMREKLGDLPSPPSARPAKGSKTGRIWEIADELYAKDTEKAVHLLKAAVIGQAVKEGINQATAQVQFGKWKGARKA